MNSQSKPLSVLLEDSRQSQDRLELLNQANQVHAYLFHLSELIDQPELDTSLIWEVYRNYAAADQAFKSDLEDLIT